jgi:hypothetical protein
VRPATLLIVTSFLVHTACGGGSGGSGPSGQAPTIPSARSGHGMAYDDARRVVLMFGGSGSTMLGDLWSWDGTRWMRRPPTT